MYVQVKNENYGYAVATYGDYVAVTNPATLKYNPLSRSIFYSGSLDVYRYNKSIDQHELLTTLYKIPVDMDVILSKESGSDEWVPQLLTNESGNPIHEELINPENADLYVLNLHIDASGSVLQDPFYTEINGNYSNKYIEIDKNNYTSSAEDGFGVSADMYQKLLVVGSPYYTQIVQTKVVSFTLTGSSVDIFDLSKTELVAPVTSSSLAVMSIPDPDISTVGTGSFGLSVSINNGWIAIGSPYVNASAGRVYMFKNQSIGNSYSWSLAQTIDGYITGAEFGHSIELNKGSGSVSGSMIIGNGSLSSNEAYLYELSNSIWYRTYTFHPTADILPLTFGNYPPYDPTMNVANGFGNSVGIYNNTVVVGAPRDRMIYEYSGSSVYQQGAIYIFEKCSGLPYILWQLVLKTNGNENIMKNNRLGYSVDIWGNNIVAGIPKINMDLITSCYIGGTIDQLHQCTYNLENLLHGQAMLLQRNTSSLNWEITNIYQRKKRFMSPYRVYGHDVETADRSFVGGAPLLLSDTNRFVNIGVNTTQSQGVNLDDITGKAYIYNYKNLRDQFQVGNVFYRNGKIVIMTSGSIFDGLFYNPINTKTYEYDVEFKGQHTIFEKQIVCTVNPGEFNVSTNPTAIMITPSILDVNGNGIFDFQDMDVILRYMQYKNTSGYGNIPSTDWSSSILKTDDEISLYNYDVANFEDSHTECLFSSSLYNWDNVNTQMQTTLDLNGDNKIDVRDMNIMWKYFSNRLTQANYSTYVTPACERNLFSDIVDYMDTLTQKKAIPQIKPLFFGYDASVAIDKTGSFLAPYATTIGLYSGLDLVAVAKLGSPIKIIPEFPINFCVKMDW